MTIDEEILSVLELIDWKNTYANQQRGILEAKKIKNILPFFQPNISNYSKNVWENCAIIVCDRSDEELEAYLPLMLEWIQDLNWPGSILILDRINKFKYSMIRSILKNTIKYALSKHDFIWMENLCDLLKEEKLKQYYTNIIDVNIEKSNTEIKEKLKKESLMMKKVLMIPQILLDLNDEKNIIENLKNVCYFTDPLFIPYIKKYLNSDNIEIKRLSIYSFNKINKLFYNKLEYYNESFNKEFLDFILNDLNNIENVKSDIYNKEIPIECALININLINRLLKNENVAIILRILNLFKNKDYLFFFNKFISSEDLKIRVLAEIGILNLNL